jgi:hypothetical protein
MDGTFWTFLLARVDPPKLKELVAEAFGVSEQHLYIAWPDFEDGPLGVASVRGWTLTGGDFPSAVEVTSRHALLVSEQEVAQRLSTAMQTEILLNSGLQDYAWMILISPAEPPRRVYMNIDFLDRNEYVINPDAYPDEDT